MLNIDFTRKDNKIIITIAQKTIYYYIFLIVMRVSRDYMTLLVGSQKKILKDKLYSIMD